MQLRRTDTILWDLCAVVYLPSACLTPSPEPRPIAPTSPVSRVNGCLPRALAPPHPRRAEQCTHARHQQE
eukprot:scaffold16899_cov97-Isochrysis_galbana.AAC.4